MTKKDRTEFNEYLRYCTDRQVLGVYLKEYKAGRPGYAALAYAEIVRRGLPAD